MDKQHAFLGLSSMAQGIAMNLVSKSSLEKPVLLWNRTHKKALDFATVAKAQNYHGFEVVEERLDLINRSNIIWSSFSDQQAVEEVWFDAAERAALQDTVVVECSTINPESATALARRIEAAGGQFVAMPVIGAAAMARNGSLICITAGNTDGIQLIKPFLEGVIAKTHIDLINKPAHEAQQLKLCQNLFSLTIAQQLAEFYTLTEKSGIGASSGRKLVDAIFPVSPQHLIYSDRMLSGACFDTSNIDADPNQVVRVASYVKAMASTLGVKLSSYDVAVENIAAIGDRGDFTAIYGVVREKSGLSFVPEEQ